MGSVEDIDDAVADRDSRFAAIKNPQKRVNAFLPLTSSILIKSGSSKDCIGQFIF
jgi:hypothetical protein